MGSNLRPWGQIPIPAINFAEATGFRPELGSDPI